MIGAIVISHGDLGKELIETTKAIVGPQEQAAYISLFPGEGPDELKQKINLLLAQINTGEGAIIFTDLFGGTPTNASLPLSVDRKVEVLTGVNLPMLLEFFSSRSNLELKELAAKVRQSGQKSIIDAKEIFLQKLKKLAP